MEFDSSFLWNHLKSAILETSEEILGFSKNENHEWFDREDE